MDIKVSSNKDGIFGIGTLGEDLEGDDGLETAVSLSLFTDKRVGEERGFWGDSLSSDEWGSKLWTLDREKLTPQTQKKLEDYALESLQWLITDKIAKSIKVRSEIELPNRINLQIEIFKADDSVSGYRFSNIWGK